MKANGIGAWREGEMVMRKGLPRWLRQKVKAVEADEVEGRERKGGGEGEGGGGGGRRARGEVRGSRGVRDLSNGRLGK